MILRIPISVSVLGLLTEQQAHYIDDEWPTVGAQDLPVKPVLIAGRRRTKGGNIPEVSSPSSFAGHGELKKSTKFI